MLFAACIMILAVTFIFPSFFSFPFILVVFINLNCLFFAFFLLLVAIRVDRKELCIAAFLFVPLQFPVLAKSFLLGLPFFVFLISVRFTCVGAFFAESSLLLVVLAIRSALLAFDTCVSRISRLFFAMVLLCMTAGPNGFGEEVAAGPNG